MTRARLSQESLHYCEAKIAPTKSDWYYSLLFCKPHQRSLMLALLCLDRELKRIIYGVSESAVATQKLNWWREELDNISQENPQHPITKLLMPLLSKSHVSINDLVSLWSSYASMQSFEIYSEAEWLERNDAHVIELIATKVLTPDGSLPDEYVQSLVNMLKMADAIIHLRYYIKHGCIPFPRVTLEACDVDEEALWRLQSSRGLEALLFYYGKEIQRLSKLKKMLSVSQRKQQKPLLAYAKLQLTLVKELARENYPVLTHHHELTPIRKLLICWFG